MSRGVVLTAAQPGNNSAVVGMEADTGKGRCIRLFVPPVERIVRCLSNPGTDDPYTARTATLQIEDKIGSGGLLCLGERVKALIGNSGALKIF